MSAAGRGVAAGDATGPLEGAAAAADQADTAAAPTAATKRDGSSAGSPSRVATGQATENAAGDAAPAAAPETAAAGHEGAAADEAAAVVSGESRVGEDADARVGGGGTAGARDQELPGEHLSGTASGSADAMVATAASKAASTSADERRGTPEGAAVHTDPAAAADAAVGSRSSGVSSACCVGGSAELENLDGEQQGKGIKSYGSKATIIEDCREQKADAGGAAAGVRNDVEEDIDTPSRTAAGGQVGTASTTRCCSVSLHFQTCARVAAGGASPAAVAAPFRDAAASTVAGVTSATPAAADDPSPVDESPAVYQVASAARAAISCPNDEFLCIEKLLHQESCGDAFLPTKLQATGVPAGLPSSSSPLVAAFCAARAAAAATAGKRARRATAAFCAAACRAEASPAAKAQSSATATTVKLPVSLAASDAAGAAGSSSETYRATEQLAGAAAVLPEQISFASVKKNSRHSSSRGGDNFASNSRSSVHSSSGGERNWETPPATCGCEEFCFCDSRGVGNNGAVLLQRVLEEVARGGTATRAAPPGAAAAACGSDLAAVSAVAGPPAGRHLAFGVGAATRPPPAAEAPVTVGSASSAAAATLYSVVSSAAGTADGSGTVAEAGDSSSRRRLLEKQLLCDYTYRITRRVLLNATERMLLVGTINFLVVLGLSLELSVRCISVACVYVHHFFDVFSFQRLERKIVASAALLLAWKYAEDTEVSTRNTRKLYELARGIYRVVMQQKAADLRAIRRQLLLLSTSSIRGSSGPNGSSSTNDSSKTSGSSEGGGTTLVDNRGDRSDCGKNGDGCKVEEDTVATTESRGHAGDTVAAAVHKASGSMSCACPLMHTSSAASSPSIRTLTNYSVGAPSSPANPCFPHAEFRFATATHSAVAAHAVADVHPVAGTAAGAPLRSAAACAPASATATGEKSTFARRAAAAFSVLLAEDVIADVASSSRWLLRDGGASFRSLCQKLRVYEAAVLRAVRFDVCPNFIPLPAIRLYVKLFLVKCCWCCLATPASAAAGRTSCSFVTCGRPTCSVTTESITPCCCTAAELSPSPLGCCPTAYTKRVASCLSVSSCKTPSSRCPCRFPERDAACFSCCSTAPVAGESCTAPCCCATDCRCCCSSSYVDSSSSPTCCCSEWPAAGLPYVQLQRRLHAEALQQLLFLCRTPFLIERSPNAVAAACVIKAAIECGLPFLMSAQHQIKLATATWRQLQHRRIIPHATSQQIEVQAQHNRGHQRELIRAKQEAEEQGTSAVEQEKLPAFTKRQKLGKGGSSTVGTIGQRAALVALELFDRHVTHFMYTINHPCDSYATKNRCYGDTATAPVAATSHEITGTAGTQFIKAKAATAVNRSHEVVYSVDSGEVRRVLAELRLASTWMGELLRVTGAEATSMMQPLSKEVRKKRVKRVNADENGIPCNGFSAVFASSTAAGAPCSPYDKGGVAAAGGGGASCRGDAPITTSGAARQSATFCRHPATADCAVGERAVVFVGAAGDPPAAASGIGSEAVSCSVEELLLQETVKLGGKHEQAVQQKRLKRCMEYIRNVLGKQPSDDEHFMAALPKPEVKHPLQHTIEEEEVRQLHQRVGQSHSRHVKGNDKFAPVY